MEKKKGVKRISFVSQGAIESYTFIACYLIGALRMIFFLNKVSDEGIAHYAYAFECYNILYIITSLALSKTLCPMVAMRQSKGQFKNRDKLYRYALLRSLLFSAVIGIGLFFSSDVLAKGMFGQANVSLALKCLGIALIPAAFLNVATGYLKGMGMKMPGCIAQIVEQIVNLIVTPAVGGALFMYGSKVSALLEDETKKNAFGAAAGSIGVLSGALFGALFLIFILFLFRSMLKKDTLTDVTKTVEHYKELAGNMEFTTAFTMISLLFDSIAVFVNQLFYFHFAKGKESSLATAYGAFYGKVRVFVFMPLLLAFLMETVLTGQIRRILKKDDVNHARQRVDQSLKELMCLLMPLAVFLGITAEQTFQLFYKGQIKIAVSMMHFAVIYIVLAGIAAITSAVLMGMDKKGIHTVNQGISCLIEIVSFALFFMNTKTPVYGIVYAMFAGVIARILLNSVILVQKLKYQPDWFGVFLMPLGASAVMGIIDFVICKFMSDALGEIFTLLICGILSCLIYMMIIMLTATLKEYELMELPFGKYFCRLGKMLGILK